MSLPLLCYGLLFSMCPITRNMNDSLVILLAMPQLILPLQKMTLYLRQHITASMSVEMNKDCPSGSPNAIRLRHCQAVGVLDTLPH